MKSPLSPHITVLIIGAHDLLRQSLVNLISMQSDMALVGTVFVPEEAVDIAISDHPDVILLDLSILEMETLVPIKVIQQTFPQAHIIATSGFPRRELIDKMIEAGVKRYIKRGDSARSIVTGIRDVCRNAPRRKKKTNYEKALERSLKHPI